MLVRLWNPLHPELNLRKYFAKINRKFVFTHHTKVIASQPWKDDIKIDDKLFTP
jgi:hypothetical protein